MLLKTKYSTHYAVISDFILSEWLLWVRNSDEVLTAAAASAVPDTKSKAID